ncbi:MAG: hypothetical protein AB1416_07225 [Actinomycetota bacterium]
MAEPPLTTGDDSDATRGREPPAGMPRWVKAFVIAAVVLGLALVISVIAGVEHGPGRHSAAPAPVAAGPEVHAAWR